MGGVRQGQAVGVRDAGAWQCMQYPLWHGCCSAMKANTDHALSPEPPAAAGETACSRACQGRACPRCRRWKAAPAGGRAAAQQAAWRPCPWPRWADRLSVVQQCSLSPSE